MKYEYDTVALHLDSRHDEDLKALNAKGQDGWRVIDRIVDENEKTYCVLLLERLVPIPYPAPASISPRIGEQGPWRKSEISHPYALALTQEEYDLILAHRKGPPNV